MRGVRAADIVLGHFEPGTRLDEVMLANRFAVPCTPVRKAFKQLAIQGLVVSRPNRGAVVAQLTPAQLDRMFEAVGELEAACARHAAIRLSASERDTLCDLHAKARAAMRTGDSDLYDRLNQQLYLVSIHGCGTLVLIDMTRGSRHRLPASRRPGARNFVRSNE
jgi:DNA-binding GntR family transcriptional regulator